MERTILNQRNDIKLMERDAAEISDVCPTCGQKLPAGKIAELEAKRNGAKDAIKSLESVLSANEAV